MGLADRFSVLTRPGPDQPGPGSPPPGAGPPGSQSSPADVAADHALADLRRRRDELAMRVAEMHWDLGGLAYEMAIRDHFRLDVLVRRAAALQQCDAELAETERLMRMEESASAGSCPSCGALHSRGAAFCWQCGTALMPAAPSSAVTAVMAPVETAP